MSELRSEEIKNAIAARLMAVAPESAVYKMAQANPEYPHFFIHQISVSDEEVRRRHHLLTYSFDLRYRVASDSSTDSRLEQDLDAMALRLFAGLNIIDCTDVKIRIEDKNYEKTDGVLHFFCKVNMSVLDRDNKESPKQMNLKVLTDLKEA